MACRYEVFGLFHLTAHSLSLYLTTLLGLSLESALWDVETERVCACVIVIWSVGPAAVILAVCGVGNSCLQLGAVLVTGGSVDIGCL